MGISSCPNVAFCIGERILNVAPVNRSSIEVLELSTGSIEEALAGEREKYSLDQTSGLMEWRRASSEAVTQYSYAIFRGGKLRKNIVASP